tara:strand:- start:69 stop:368 length:300 start_codon:yes stop_codon:yes gene_type:complete
MFCSTNTAPSTGPNEQNVSVTVPTSGTITAEKIYASVVEMDISGLICARADDDNGGVGDGFWFAIQRNGTSDTNNGDAEVFSIELEISKWCEGKYSPDT